MKSENDNNQNNFYENISARIAETYAKNTAATNKNSLYDSYIKAFRWASDRISSGVIGFVTNAGFLDGAAMDGLRKNFSEEFSEIFIFNLRGNQRTQGEISRKEGGKIFGSGSRAPIAITILVKKSGQLPVESSQKNSPLKTDNCQLATIRYYDIGDYLTRKQKLEKISEIKTVLNENFQLITPNEKFDWINQRGNIFEKFILLGDKKNNSREVFFDIYSRGIVTGRDAFCYNFSKKSLQKNIQTTINFYNSHEPTETDSKKINWVRSTVQDKIRGIKYFFDKEKIIESEYRPFCREFFYFDKNLNDMTYQMPKFFPEKNSKNILICIQGLGSNKNFSVFITKKICDVQFQFNGQCFPLYYYESDESNLFEETALRRDGVSDFIEKMAREKYGLFVLKKFGENNFCIEKIHLKEEIFYYVYGFLHLKSYREKFSAELKKVCREYFWLSDTKISKKFLNVGGDWRRFI